MFTGSQPFNLNNTEILRGIEKTLTAGYGAGSQAGTSSSGAALKIEELESMLKHVTFEEEEIVFYKLLSDKGLTKNVRNLYVQYDDQSSVGEHRRTAYREGNAPHKDAKYVRTIRTTSRLSWCTP